MDETMEAEEQNASVGSSSPAEASPPENHEESPTHRGTIIPNRIFVGGIDNRVDESDLRQVFSHHGAVKEVKIVTNHSGMPKGYGFVTFENQEDVVKLLQDGNGISFNDKKLIIDQAFRKQKTSVKRVPLASLVSAVLPLTSCGTLQPTTTAGYLHHSQVAYFCCPPNYLWPWAAPPAMLPQSHQPVYQQPASPHYQCVPTQYQWNVIQPAPPSSPAVFSQPSEHLYQPVDCGFTQPPLPVMEDATEEGQTGGETSKIYEPALMLNV